MPGLSKAQTGVAIGMAVGLAATVGAFAWPNQPPVPSNAGARLEIWFACAVSACLWLLISVGRLANHRFFSPADIDGAGLTEGTARAKLLQSLIQNTLEQALLAVAAWGAWLFLAPEGRRGLVIVCAILFSLGRLLFFALYARGAAGRALGFALTFYPTVGLYLFLLPAVIARLFA